MRALVAVVAAAVLLVGCGTSDDREQVRGVVERFYAALRDDRAREACQELSAATVEALERDSGTSCPDAIGELDDEGDVVRAEVYLTTAKVELRGGASAFLDREPTGWKLTAVGCRAAEGKPRDRPLECEVEA